MVDKSKLYKMLALPEGTEDTFIAEHDVGTMTSREVEEAVRQEREKARQEREQAVNEARAEARQDKEQALKEAAERAEAELEASVKRAYAETKEEHENDLKRAVDAARALEKEKKAHQRDDAAASGNGKSACRTHQAARQAAEKGNAAAYSRRSTKTTSCWTRCRRNATKPSRSCSTFKVRSPKATAQRLPDDELTPGGFRNGCAAVYRHMRPDAAHGQRVCGHADGNAPEIRRAAEDD